MAASTEKGFAVAPAGRRTWAAAVIREAGGEVVELERAGALVWMGGRPAELRRLLETAPGVRWVQLPNAGVESLGEMIRDGRTWTCAKGVYADQVAEHVLALALAGFRRLKERARASSWDRDDGGQTLLGAKITLVGGGGIAESVVRLTAPFRCEVTVVRQRPQPMEGVTRVVGASSLQEALATAQLVVLALALTPGSTGIMGAPQLRCMRPDAWLVNVSRGRHVDTDALVTALREGWFAGAALDVTDPEPLPDGHPLWDLPNCIITPHTANPGNLAQEVLSDRIRENVTRYLCGQALVGVVDPELGY